MKHDFDAIVSDWEVHDYAKTRVVVGRIYEDKKGRFSNGHLIQTSKLKSCDPHDGDIIVTMNSRYLLCGPI